MTLPDFDLHRPETVAEAIDLLERHGEDAVLMHGGTELLLLLKLGLADYGHVVDLKRVVELRGISSEGGALRIGAGTTHLELERSAEVGRCWPALAQMERTVANIRVRAAGTIGGNLAFSDPHSDPATFLLVSEASVLLHGRAGERELALADFLIGPYETALAPGELLVRVHVPPLPAGGRAVHAKLSFHERPAATVTCLATPTSGGLGEVRLAVGSVGPLPVRATEAEGLLGGLDPEAPDADVLHAAGEAAARAANASTDANGSADYKRALVAALVRRTFLEACQAR